MENISELSIVIEKKEWITPELSKLTFNETEGGPGSGYESGSTFPNS